MTTTLLDESYEGGSIGAALSDTNSAYTTVIGGAGITFNSTPAVGSKAVTISASASSSYGRLDFTAISTAGYRFYIKDFSAPAALTFIAALMSSSTIRHQCRVNADGTVAIRNGTIVPAGGTTTGAMVTGNDYRVEVVVNFGASTQRVKVFPLGSNTVITGGDTGDVLYDQGTFDNYRAGVVAAATWSYGRDGDFLHDSATFPGGPDVPTVFSRTDSSVLSESSFVALAILATDSALQDELSVETITTENLDDAFLTELPSSVTALLNVLDTAEQAEALATVDGTVTDETLTVDSATLSESAQVSQFAFLWILRTEKSGTRWVSPSPFLRRTGNNVLHYEVPIAYSLLKVNGEWIDVYEPDEALVAEAEHYFMGGREYEIGNDIAQELLAAGYAALLTLPSGDTVLLDIDVTDTFTLTEQAFLPLNKGPLTDVASLAEVAVVTVWGGFGLGGFGTSPFGL